MSYPRKRALLACDFCRQRKRRCDGKKPICGNCTEAEADCHYQELPTQRLESSSIPASMSRRLERIENLLKSHSEAITAISQQSQQPDTLLVQAPHQNLPTNGGPHPDSPTNPGTIVAAAAGSPNYTSPGAELPLFTIPQKHLTSTNSLLGLPVVKSLVGDFPDDFFFRLESRRPFPIGSWMATPESLPYLNRDVTDLLVTTFFSIVHPCHPILDRENFFAVYESVLDNGLGVNLQSALCLVVFALGMIASQPLDADARVGNWAPGMEYFEPALQILLYESTFSFGSDLLLPQGLIFAGVYYAYLAQPLHSWKLIHMASTNVQLLYSRCINTVTDESYREQIIQACWSCFLIECDRIAEFDLPRSGIETFVDDMTFPKAGNPPDRERLCYLAEISIRRLLNRVHNLIYNSGERGSFSAKPDRSSLPMSVSSLVTLTSELDHQLLLWYDSVPEVIKPSLGLDPTVDDRERILRIRYYATKHIIYRQFVLFVSSLPEDQGPSSIILDRAQTCIESCRLYLQNTGEILKKPSQYTWTLSQSSFGAILVLTVASLSKHLKHLVPDILQLQELLVDNVTKWATPESSFESVIWIIDDIRRKRRYLYD